MATQQEQDAIAGTHNAAGYDVSGNRIDAAATGYVQGPANSPINSSTLQPQSPVNYSTPTPTTIPDVTGLDTPLSAPEKKANDLTSVLMGLNTNLEGRSAFEAGLNAENGVPAIQQTISDLGRELTHTTNQARANSLQIQEQNRLMFSGKGIASAIVDRKGQNALRQSALDSAIESFRVSSLIDAANGQLSSAQAKVKTAVDAKYGPILEKIATATKNLELIKNSPEYTAAEKQRATKALEEQAKKKEEAEQAKADAIEIGKTATEAASNGASFVSSKAYPTLAVAVSAISKATTKEEALRIAVETGLSQVDELSTVVTEVNGRKVLINTQTGATIKDLGLAEVGSGATSTQVIEIEGKKVLINSKTGEVIRELGSTDPGAPKTAEELAENSLSQIDFLLDSVKTAKELSNASGASGMSKYIGDKLIGDTKFRRLEAQTNTLRTNVLTLMTDPGVKKYFGPQMSEADVRLMTAAGTTLNPENQSPEDLRTELSRLETLFRKMKTALSNGTRAEQSGGRMVVAPDGTLVEITN